MVWCEKWVRLAEKVKKRFLGAHKELLEVENGIYANLVKAQQFKDDSGEDQKAVAKYDRQTSRDRPTFDRNVS